VEVKLQNVMTGIAIREICPDDDPEVRYCLEFEFRVATRLVKFQSYPLSQRHALELNTAINEWALEYNAIRKKVGVLQEAIKGVEDATKRANRQLRGK
jgi:hypothetical protein